MPGWCVLGARRRRPIYEALDHTITAASLGLPSNRAVLLMHRPPAISRPGFASLIQPPFIANLISHAFLGG
jgi:hypothetical protein